MKNPEFQKLVDQNLSGLVWDQRKRQEVLCIISKEEKSMKKVSRALILSIALLCLTVSALAAGLVFSPKVDHDAQAEAALLEKYGLTAPMLTFFTVTHQEEEAAFRVSYDGIEPYSYVLGSYTVLIKDGKAKVSWSWDAANPSEGFEAENWGAAQLQKMLSEKQEGRSLIPYEQKASEIAAMHGAVKIPGPVFDPEALAKNQRQQELDANEAKARAKLSIPQMEALAREALTLRYQLTEEQSACLMCQQDNGFFLLFGPEKLPCYQFYFSLGFAEDGYQGPGSGIYTVKINTESGTAEDIFYDSALSGNG